MNWTALRDHLLTAMASAALLGGGATIITNKVAIGELSVRVAALEELGGKIDGLREDLQKTREELARAGRPSTGSG